MSSLTPKDWLDAGYRKFPDSFKHADFGLQRRFADEIGIRYFLTVYAYDWDKFPERIGDRWGFQAEVQFSAKTFPVLDITLHRDNLGIQEIEEYVRRLWIKLDCPYYEYFE